MADDTTPQGEPSVPNPFTLPEIPAAGVATPESDQPLRTAGDAIRVALGSTLVGALIGGTIALCVDVESVIFTFPLCAILGLCLAVAARRLLSWRVFLWAMSAPIAVIVCAMTIAIFELNPREAAIPIRCMWGVYVVFSVPVGFGVLPVLVRWRGREHARRTGLWRFQVKFLLIQTLVLSGALAIAKLFSDAHTDYMMFASGSAAIMFIGGLVVSAFLAELRHP